jgi:hypothetical protein
VPLGLLLDALMGVKHHWIIVETNYLLNCRYCILTQKLRHFRICEFYTGLSRKIRGYTKVLDAPAMLKILKQCENGSKGITELSKY